VPSGVLTWKDRLGVVVEVEDPVGCDDVQPTTDRDANAARAAARMRGRRKLWCNG
jgi:hypothetical protein